MRVALLSGLLVAQGAGAGASLRLEPAVAVAISLPQSRYFVPGGSGFLAGQFAIADWLDVQLQLGGLALPAASGAPVTGAGSAFLLGAGLRARRPLAGARVVPWLDGSVSYANTGSLSRVALGAGVGVLLRLSSDDRVLFGPHARFAHLFKLVDETGFTTADAQLLSFGLTIEVQLGERAAPPGPPAAVPAPPQPPPQPPVAGAPLVEPGLPPRPSLPLFRGRVLDLDERPLKAHVSIPKLKTELEASPSFELQLPAGVYRAEASAPGFLSRGRTLVLKDDQTLEYDFLLRPAPPKAIAELARDRISINQTVLFEENQARILPESYPVLDAVVDILLAHPAVKRVRIEGHTDRAGREAANLALSRARAFAVMEYLIEHGVEVERLSAVGYGAGRPLVKDPSPAAQLRNRRVQFEIVGEGP